MWCWAYRERQMFYLFRVHLIIEWATPAEISSTLYSSGMGTRVGTSIWLWFEPVPSVSIISPGKQLAVSGHRQDVEASHKLLVTFEVLVAVFVICTKNEPVAYKALSVAEQNMSACILGTFWAPVNSELVLEDRINAIEVFLSWSWTTTSMPTS